MTARRVEAGQGWQWLVGGWRLFLKAPGLWIVMLLIYIAINVVLSLIPLIGGVAEALLTPALSGGMIFGAAALASGNPLEIQHLFQAFRDRERLGPMLTLGALLLLGYVVLGLVVGGLVVGWMAGSGMMDNHMAMNEGAIFHLLAGGGGLVLLIVLVLGALLIMAMFYAVPLVMLRGDTPLRALQESFSACWLNIWPFLVFGLIYILFAFLAAIPLGLGFLVLIPVMFAAVYESYRDVFDEGPSQLMPPSAPVPF